METQEKLRASIAYVERTDKQPFYYANAHEKDYVPLDPVEMTVTDARGEETSLDREGFILVSHQSAIADLTNMDAVQAQHPAEIEALLKKHTGADYVNVVPRGILRFSEKSGKAGSSDNSHPARFAHVDMSKESAANARAGGAPEGKAIARSAQFNVWRVLSGTPVDVPLALCEWPSVAPQDLIEAEAIFDPPGGAPGFSFNSYVLAQNPQHRWRWFSHMTPDEAIIFKSSDSDESRAPCTPHVAFDNPLAGPDAPPRISLEVRATCYWFT